MPDLQGRPYEHQLPHRPSRLPKRTEPPPDRAEAPDLRLFLFAGLVLVGIVAFVAIPYLVRYLVLWLTGG
jgi:hypothetical protein